MNVKVKPINYYGYLQGFKVYINGKKYPRIHGHWYTFINKERAISQALHDYKRR